MIQNCLFFKFCMIGYSFTVLVCLVMVGILLFYALLPIFAKTYPYTARRLKRVFTTLLCIGLIVVSITECIIIKASFGHPETDCDYVVVLGAKVRDSGPSVSLMDRIYGARDYLQAHPDAIAILSGGQGVDEPMTEAAAMYDELVKLGIGLLVLYAVTSVVRQILEPKLIGEGLGLHPLLSLGAMYAGLRLFGVWGMILAPLTAAGLRAVFGREGERET